MTLRARLAVLSGTLAGFAMVLVSLLTYAMHSQAHYDDLDRALVAAVTHVLDELEAVASDPGLEPAVGAPATPELMLRWYSPDGALLTESPNVMAAPAIDPTVLTAEHGHHPFDYLVGLAPSLVPVETGPGILGLTEDEHGVRWRVYVRPLESPPGYLVSLASLDRIDASVDRLRTLGMLFSAAGAVTIALASWVLSGRALLPVRTLTRTAAAIADSGDFRRRVPLTPTGDELGRLARTFNQMLEKLEESYRFQQRFVADASHELRTPLTGIQANLELIEQRPDMPPEERNEAVQEARRETYRLARLVADLLALARADAGVGIQHQRVELDRVVFDVFESARHLSAGQELELARLEPLVVHGDADRLTQLLLILVDNAIRYTPPAGRVSLGLRREGTAAVLEVADDGVGIAPDDLPHVFEWFYRADPARSGDSAGTGLGLAIASWIVEQHEGEIGLSSQPGRGTRVVVRLPIPAAHSSPDAAAFRAN